MTSYKEIHKACVVAYIDSADTAIRNALEDGEDIVLHPTETQRLKEALKVTKSIMSRLLDEIDYDEEEPEDPKEPQGEFFKIAVTTSDVERCPFCKSIVRFDDTELVQKKGFPIDGEPITISVDQTCPTCGATFRDTYTLGPKPIKTPTARRE